MTRLTIRTVAEDWTLQERIEAMYAQLWPRLILEGHPAGIYTPPAWQTIYECWPQFQFGLFDSEGRLVGAGNAAALPWDEEAACLPEEGFDWALTTASQAHALNTPASTLCALGIMVDPTFRGHGISSVALTTMRMMARSAGYQRLIGPVRPTAKLHYQLIPMTTYMEWRTPDGLPFDPWLRTHVRSGGQIVKSASCSATFAGTVAEWVEWGGMPLPGSGHYLLPGLFAPVQIDVERDTGLYVEPAVWVVHHC